MPPADRPSDDPFPEAQVEALLAPAVHRLAAPTSLSPLPYDLNAGVPDRATLPADALLEAARRALAEDAAAALTYGGQQGYEPLRAWIAGRESRDARDGAAPVTAAHVTLTSGSAHGLDNIAATFVGEGDIVVVGAPTYPGAIRTFRARGATIVESPQDDDGLVPSALARVLDTRRMTGRQAKLLYVQSNYDNPSGATLPLQRREAIVRIAREHGVPIVEDDAYTGIDLAGPPLPSLFSIAGGRGVMHCGTFSKTVATGLRVGWIAAQPEIVRRLVFMRFDNGSSPFLHRLVHQFVTSKAYEPHVARLREVYRERRDASAEALREFCEPYVTFRTPAGGFFHWLHLHVGLDGRAVAQAAAEHGVAVTPGAGYYASGGGEDRVRLVFSALPPEDLREAIRRLGQALEDVARQIE
ncbi:MAG: PLP-dependent aminotransferase family protein [Dehalococcoidia bacterium]|nr:PLP-dependent aminotransferase family protein [Dehalococcoidia bacterium]